MKLSPLLTNRNQDAASITQEFLIQSPKRDHIASERLLQSPVDRRKLLLKSFREAVPQIRGPTLSHDAKSGCVAEPSGAWAPPILEQGSAFAPSQWQLARHLNLRVRKAPRPSALDRSRRRGLIGAAQPGQLRAKWANANELLRIFDRNTSHFGVDSARTLVALRLDLARHARPYGGPRTTRSRTAPPLTIG
jgi:hypothetical protein